MLILFLVIVAIIVGIGIVWQYFTNDDEPVESNKQVTDNETQQSTADVEQQVMEDKDATMSEIKDKESTTNQTLNLIIPTLKGLGCSIELYGDSLSFVYRGLSFVFEADLRKRFIHVTMFQGYTLCCAEETNIWDELDKILFDFNKDYFPTYDCFTYGDDSYIVLEGHGILTIGYNLQNQKEYLQTALDRFVTSHNKIYDRIKEFVQEDNTNDKKDENT